MTTLRFDDFIRVRVADLSSGWLDPRVPKDGTIDEDTQTIRDSHGRPVMSSDGEPAVAVAWAYFTPAAPELLTPHSLLMGALERTSTLRTAFDALDKCQQDKLTENDFGAALEILGRGLSADELHAIFVEVDKDGSGTIDFTEVLPRSQTGDLADTPHL